MQPSFNRNVPAGTIAAETVLKLADLKEGQAAVIEQIELHDDLAYRLMELGFLPGMKVTAARCAPGGDPRVFRVDGTEIALRRETAARLVVKL